MKTDLFRIRDWCVPALTVFLAVSASGMCEAQTTVVKKRAVDQDVAGTIRSAGVDGLVIQADATAQPQTYRYAKTVQYFDDAGKGVARDALTPGVPVTVQYMRDTKGLLAERVIIHQAVAKTTEPAAVERGAPAATSTIKTTTVTEKVKPTMFDGVLNRWEPDRFELATKNGVLKLHYSQDTKLVDLDDKLVDVNRMRSGLPVTVRFKEEGDHLMATQIRLNQRSMENVR